MRLYRVIDALDEVATETGRSVPQIALNWLLRRPSVSTVLIGARSEAQLRDNLGGNWLAAFHGTDDAAGQGERTHAALSLLPVLERAIRRTDAAACGCVLVGGLLSPSRHHGTSR
jgi:hypothetical protein